MCTPAFQKGQEFLQTYLLGWFWAWGVYDQQPHKSQDLWTSETRRNFVRSEGREGASPERLVDLRMHIAHCAVSQSQHSPPFSTLSNPAIARILLRVSSAKFQLPALAAASCRCSHFSPTSSPMASGPDPSFRICGVHVDFPYKPYAPQLAFMGKVLAALELSRLPHRSSSANALLESPTGSGKTLALLCATLAWQRQFLSLPPPPLPPPPPPGSDPLLAGGGFLVDEPPSGREVEEDFVAVEAPSGGRSFNRKSKNRKVPKIYYASRTHTQITQVIRELRKTKYRVSMAVLGARRHYCTNKHVARKNNVDEDCKLLMKDEQSCCPQFKNVSKLESHSSLQKGGSNAVHDIEDLVGLGHKVKGCAYFAARALATEADIVFCPYSYVMDPIIRNAMEVNLQGAIVVLDEAHNIEDVAREAGSIDLETGLLQDLRLELEQLATSDETADIYIPLLEMVQSLLDWVYYQEKSLSKLDFEHYASSWRGAKAVRELRVAGTCLETFQLVLECSKKAVVAASNPDETVSHLSGRAAIAMEGLFSALKFMLLNNGHRAGDYQLVVRKFVKRDEGLAVAGWVTTVSLWCLNPGVVFEDIASSARSIILTSGTLSPMDSFASELGVPFEIQMEAPHVIDMDKQVWAAAVSTGPDNISLNASYKNADGYAFQDALGLVLEEVFKVVPDGALIFFPSYKLLDKLCSRWKSTGQWERLSNVKELFVEPRGNNDQFELVLQEFYKSVNPERTPDRNSKVGAEKKRGLKRRGGPRSTGRKSGGAAFFAVCRGKVSEGIDFSDKNARIVVIVGIPFPNVKDIQVTLKKQYNQENRSLKNLLSGDEWYCQQTFRALNQAVGRCIRHRNDYGAILLLDDRFQKPGNIQYMSKWLRKSIRQCESFRESLEGLKTFFKGFETSSTVMKELCIVPTVRSNLVSTHKAKLLITSSTKKPENQPNLKDYITKVKKSSGEVPFQEPNSSLLGRSTAKEQVDPKKGRKTDVSSPLPGEQLLKVDVAQARQLLGTIEPSNPEITEQNAVADPDSEYEIFSLRYDASFLPVKSDMEYVSKETQLGVDNCASIQSPKTTAVMLASSEMALEPTRSGEMTEKETPVLESLVNVPGLNRTKHSMTTQKRKLDPSHEETALDVPKVPPKRSNSLGLGFSVQPKRGTASLQIDVNHVKERMRDQHRPAYKVDMATENIKDAEASHSHVDDRTCNDDSKSGLSHREKPSCCRDFEDIKPHNRTQVGSSSEKSIHGAHDEKWQTADLGSPCGLNRNLLRTIDKDNGRQIIDSEARSMNNAEAHSVLIPPGDNGDSLQRKRRLTEVKSELPSNSSPNDPSNANYLISRPQHSNSICDITGFVSTDRVDSGLDLSCSGKGERSSKIAILCESCSYHYTDYAEVVYETFNKSYLASLFSGDIQCTKLRILLMEYHSLRSLVKEKLCASVPLESVASDDSRKKSLRNTGVWVREDGCVYEHIFCPQCEDQSICVGVHVAACDKINLSLMGKVLFFEDYVKVISMCGVEIEQRQAEQKVQQPTTQSDISGIMKTRSATPAKAKLKLQRSKP